MATGSAIMPTPSSMTTPPSILPNGGNRHDVAVADRGQRCERPPGGGGDRAEFVRLRFALEEIGRGGREQQQHQNDEQRAKQCAVFVLDDAAEGLQGRRVAHELQQAEQAKHPQHPEIHRHQPGEIKRQHGEQVDQHHRPGGKTQPRLPRLHAAQHGNVYRAPQPQQIFDAEHRHREDVESVEIRPVAISEMVDRLGGEGDGVQEDQNDDEDVDEAPGGMGVAAHFENVVNLSPPAAPG